MADDPALAALDDAYAHLDRMLEEVGYLVKRLEALTGQYLDSQNHIADLKHQLEQREWRDGK